MQKAAAVKPVEADIDSVLSKIYGKFYIIPLCDAYSCNSAYVGVCAMPLAITFSAFYGQTTKLNAIAPMLNEQIIY